MKLYYAPGACSLSPHIVLREAGADFQLLRVDLRAHRTADDRDYTAINPKGYVPALELEDGSLLTEGPAIVQYVADRYPMAGLAPPAGTLARARLQEWLTFIGTELHKSFGVLFNPAAAEDWKTHVRQNITRRLGYVAGALGSRPYLLGEEFSCADAYLFVILRWAGQFKIELSPWPVLKSYLDRVGARPKVREALAAEGLSATGE
jgi:glutathione S-transferase